MFVPSHLGRVIVMDFHLFQSYLSIRTCHAHFERMVGRKIEYSASSIHFQASRWMVKSKDSFYFLFIALQLIESFS